MRTTVEALPGIRQQHDGETLALVHGVFDILHPGHVRHLMVAKQLADVVAVALWCDENVASRKGFGRPVNTFVERAEVVDALKPVDYVFVVQGVGPSDELMKPVIAALEPDHYVLNGNNKLFTDVMGFSHGSGRYTALVHDISYQHKSNSTTQIVEKIKTNA